MTHDEIRKRHFENLNGYRRSAEYASYARSIGAEPPTGDLPSLIARRWEIDEEIYHEFLEMLPPLGWRGGSFYMSEFTFADITNRFSKEGDRYFCEFARYPERSGTHRPAETPWGPAQSAQELAPGIVRYDTASHGGYYVSPECVAMMPKPLRDFSPWAGPNWYEEDCDWCIVVLAFPQLFPSDDIPVALATLQRYDPDLYRQFAAIRDTNGRAA